MAFMASQPRILSHLTITNDADEWSNFQRTAET